jgi:cell division protein FtsL
MLRPGAVRQSTPSRISPRRTVVSQQNHQRNADAALVRRYRLGPLLVGVFLCLAAVGVYMWPRVQVVRLAYRLQNSERQLKALIQEQDQLRLELAALKDPQRVYHIAADQLGMRMPRQDQVFIVTRDLNGR